MNNKPRSRNDLLDARDILERQLGLFYGAQIGDLGCGGTGYFGFEMARIVGEKGIVYAVDVLKMILKNIDHKAKMYKLNNIRTIWSNLENYGATAINDRALDFTTLVTVLFQNKHPERIMREAVRMLKTGGKLLVIEWKAGRFPFGPPAEIKIAESLVGDLALGAGLKKVKDIEVDRFHYGVVFEKI